MFNISVNFKDTKKLDHIFKTSLDLFWCILCHLLIIGNQRRYSSRLSISMFIGTPCISYFERRFFISRSRAVHCLWITHLCSSFGYYLIIINISLFIREALNFSVIYVSIEMGQFHFLSFRSFIVSRMTHFVLFFVSFVFKIIVNLASISFSCNFKTFCRIFFCLFRASFSETQFFVWT